MIIYATQFPVKKEYSKEIFTEMVVRWNQGSNFNRLNLDSWDGKTLPLEHQENNSGLSIFDFDKFGVVASRFFKNDEHGIWETDFLLNYRKCYLTVRVTLETTEFTTDFTPQYYPPYFVKMVLAEGYANVDRELPVSSRPVYIDCERMKCLGGVVNHSVALMLPLVIVTATNTNATPLDVENLAFRLQGVAHVLCEQEIGVFVDDLREIDVEKRPGQIYLIFPNKHMKNKVVNLNGGIVEDENLTVKKIVNEVYEYANRVMRHSIDTWDGLQTQDLHERNKELLDRNILVSKENEDLLDVFDEQLKETEKENDNLVKKNSKLMSENEYLRMKLASIDKQPLLYFGEEMDFYTGEIKEIVLDILNDYKCYDGSRRQHLIQDLLENNEFSHVPEKRRERLKDVLKGYRTLTSSVKSFLEDMGFVITDYGKHYKWTYYGDQRYIYTASKTSSDGRGGKNAAADISKIVL